MEATTLDDLAEAFSFLEGWEDRYQYIIDLGKKLPAMPDDLKTEANRVHGCQSNVWVAVRHDADQPDRLNFLADSDAVITKGLVAMVLMLLTHRTPNEILAVDVDPLFAQIGLDQHLSPTRRNGLHGMVKKVRSIATSA